jgi:hypothetical protein
MFMRSSQPLMHSDAMVTHSRTLDQQAVAPGRADGAVNSENDRLILTLFAFEGQERRSD